MCIGCNESAPSDNDPDVEQATEMMEIEYQYREHLRESSQTCYVCNGPLIGKSYHVFCNPERALDALRSEAA